jgi:hypothetical protein
MLILEDSTADEHVADLKLQQIARSATHGGLDTRVTASTSMKTLEKQKNGTAG